MRAADQRLPSALFKNLLLSLSEIATPRLEGLQRCPYPGHEILSLPGIHGVDLAEDQLFTGAPTRWNIHGTVRTLHH